MLKTCRFEMRNTPKPITMKSTIPLLFLLMFYLGCAKSQGLYNNFTNGTIKTLDNQQRLTYLNLQYREDGSTIFTPTTIIVFKTNQGRYGKLYVEQSGETLILTWLHVFTSDGAMYIGKSSLGIRNLSKFDLDEGTETQVSAYSDFQWEYLNGKGRLIPLSGAVFYVIPESLPQPVITIKNPKQFAPKGNIANNAAYFQSDFQRIRATEDKMRQSKEFGGFEGSPLHLKAGSILFYKTNKDAFGKMQVLAFGQEANLPPEFYIRWTTYKKDGSIDNAREYEDLFAANALDRSHDLDGATFHGFDFNWRIDNNLLFIKARKDAKFYLLGDNESGEAVPEGKPEQKSKSISSVTWQLNSSNNSTTNTPTLELKACVETAETIKEYILVQNGQRSYTTRGLIVQQANDCFNAFNKTVTLKTGENQFQLIAQSNAGELKSEVFTITYNPNATASNTLSNAKSQRRLALVIGNAAYPTAGLKNPVNDATDIAAALRSMGFEVINALNADRRKMNEAIDDFGSRLKKYDLGFFFYAGHGLQIKGENYLVPIDAKIQSQGEVEYECYPVGRVLSKMDEANNQSNVIVLDACRDNPFQRSWSRSTGANGLANINAPQGTFIGFATSPGSTAADGTGRNGVYTGALLEHIRKPNLTVDQLFNAVNGTVKKLTNNQQVPWKASSMSEDLYLTK